MDAQGVTTSGGDGNAPSADAVADRVLASALGALELLSIYAGDRLGWYRSLAEHGAMTPEELARRTATDPRYAREWLEQQATVGLITSRRQADGHHVFVLPAGAAEVLTDAESLVYLAPLARMITASARQIDSLLAAYRAGTGVSWDQFGDDARESQADMNRPWFRHKLADALRSDPDLHARLSAPGLRILDVGCGAGWSTQALAAAYPDATVVGVDIDGPSIEAARAQLDAHPATAGRVEFRHVDPDDPVAGEAYDVSFFFECLHDMPQPAAVLRAVRAGLGADGFVVVMDEAVAEEFGGPGDDVEKLMYGFSLFVCLPDGLSSSPSVGTGTLMRPATLARYAREAGFADTRILPIDDFGFFRFYALSGPAPAPTAPGGRHAGG